MKELRAERGIPMKEAARQLEVPYTTYVNYEKGFREPNSEMLIKIASFYNCSVDYLIGKSAERISDDVLDQAGEADQFLLELMGNLYETQKLQALIDAGRTEEARALLASHVSSEQAEMYANMSFRMSDKDPQVSAILACTEQLNAQGLERLQQYAEDLVDSGKYQKG